MELGSPADSCTQTIDRAEIIRLLDTALTLQGSRSARIAKLPLHGGVVVKYGTGIHLWEAKNMILAASIPGVRVPKVHDAWEADDNSGSPVVTYIVMDFIEGQILTTLWPTLDSARRDEIHHQLSIMLAALHGRQVDHPGPVDGGVSESFFFTDYGAGPFKTSQDIERWFNRRLRVCQDYGHVSRDGTDFTGLFDNLVMCHLDLHTHNMIVDASDSIWLLDWNTSGGYPVFFEEAALGAWPDRLHSDFSKGLKQAISTGIHDAELKRLYSIDFAISTGTFLEPLNAD